MYYWPISKMYIHQLHRITGCSLEDLSRKDVERESWMSVFSARFDDDDDDDDDLLKPAFKNHITIYIFND